MAADSEVVNFIRVQMDTGASKELTVEALKQLGHTTEGIEEAFMAFEHPETVPPPPPPPAFTPPGGVPTIMPRHAEDAPPTITIWRLIPGMIGFLVLITGALMLGYGLLHPGAFSSSALAHDIPFLGLLSSNTNVAVATSGTTEETASLAEATTSALVTAATTTVAGPPKRIHFEVHGTGPGGRVIVGSNEIDTVLPEKIAASLATSRPAYGLSYQVTPVSPTTNKVTYLDASAYGGTQDVPGGPIVTLFAHGIHVPAPGTYKITVLLYAEHTDPHSYEIVRTLIGSGETGVFSSEELGP